MENKIKRLQSAVIILTVLFFISVSFSIYSAIQIKVIASKMLCYSEIKKDVLELNRLCTISETKFSKSSEYTRDKLSKGLEKLKKKKDK